MVPNVKKRACIIARKRTEADNGLGSRLAQFSDDESLVGNMLLAQKGAETAMADASIFTAKRPWV
jgi:hypothetical protein